MSDRKGKLVSVSWYWSKDQCITYKVSPLPGSLMSASAIAKQLLAISKLLEATEDGMRWKTCIRGIFTESDGSLTFDLAVAPKTSSLTSKDNETSKTFPDEHPQAPLPGGRQDGGGAVSEGEAFERGRAAGRYEAALETQYGPFSAHVQAVFREARKLRDALEGDKLVDGLGAALNAYDDFMNKPLPAPPVESKSEVGG